MFPFNVWLPCRDSDFEAKIFYSDAPGNYPLIGVYREDRGDDWVLAEWTAGGFFYSSLREDALDVLPPKQTVWLNIYETSTVCGDAHWTREAADRAAGSDRIACREVQFTPGEGLTPPTPTEE